MRDLFGNLFYLSLENKIDLDLLPLSVCHVDGSMLKSPKSSLLKHLETRAESQPPVDVDVTMIDAMFFLHLHTNLPCSFKGVAHYLLTRICECKGTSIYFVADKWITPSIKDCERTKRGVEGVILYTTRPAQKRPAIGLPLYAALLLKSC